MKKLIALVTFCAMLVMSVAAFAAENTNATTTNTNTVKRWILVNIPARSLRVYDNDKTIAIYPVGVGKIVTPTPQGYFKVVEKIVNPTWTDPEDTSVSIASGPDNPLGYRWIGIGGNYGIHGTNKPDSVGHYVSNGCIRMVEANVEKVFDMVDVGTEVQLVYNRLVIDKAQDGRVAYYIYPDGYNIQKLSVDFVKQGLAGYGIADFVTNDDIQKAINASNGQPNYVASPVNIMYNNAKLPYKAVNYQNLLYVPVNNLAKTLNTSVSVANNQVTSTKGSANVNFYSGNPYMRVTDMANVFDTDYKLDEKYTTMTLIPVANTATTVTTNTNVPNKDGNVDTTKQLNKTVEQKIEPQAKSIDVKDTVVTNKVDEKVEIENDKQGSNK